MKRKCKKSFSVLKSSMTSRKPKVSLKTRGCAFFFKPNSWCLDSGKKVCVVIDVFMYNLVHDQLGVDY